MQQTLLENIPQIIGYLFGAGGILAYIFERRKKQAETKGVEEDAKAKEIENKGSLVQVYREALDDLTNRYEKKYKEVSELYDRKVGVLNDEVSAHKRINSSLKRENSELRKQNAQLRRKNEELQIIIEKLEKRIKQLESNSIT